VWRCLINPRTSIAGQGTRRNAPNSLEAIRMERILNEQRHDLYLYEERLLYLERVDRSIPGIEFTLARYIELWQHQIDLKKSA
jgi:hypothetical protein